MSSATGLLEQARHRSAEALASGAQIPIATGREVVEAGGIPYLIHHLSGLPAKRTARRTQNRTGENPFLPPDPELTVATLSETHLCVLNKFNVLPDHLLIITRRFESQNELLTRADFHALAVAMADMGGLGFYNAGTIAGASQEHKHLQLVPVPLGDGPSPTPIDEVLDDLGSGLIQRHARLPFEHRLARVSEISLEPASATRLHQLYHELLTACRIGTTLHPYNLLLTARWMMLVPRRREFFEGISVNSLGFAGSLLVPEASLVERLRSLGPAQVLEQVAGAVTDPA